ncbi:MAG: DEAD/DEAH box helicase [Desulfobacteraceae bacterium]|nr:MAG: DEAD/DEAH box helicase [Desulfobacteraceae bacterium]
MTENSLSLFDPLVARWFRERYGAPTEIQASGWQSISRGTHLLITAPTGSGKTLAAFLWALNQWITARWDTGRTHVLYVSPLKALNNDIQRNILLPLAELQQLFAHAQRPFPDIQVQTRSGDTPASDRRRMVRRPPEILITTPESLHLLLSSASGRSILGSIRTVLLDEIHAVLASRRGALLISAVERLVRLSGEFQRIALSATVRPLATAAAFVGGFRLEGPRERPRYEPRKVVVLSPQSTKMYDLGVRLPEVPESPRDPNDFWEAFAEQIRARLQINRSTLVFANSRRLCEKLTFLINHGQDRLLAYAHHGSLSKEIRTEVERSLKTGSLKAILATGSLELGIDIGALDEVILVQAPWSVAEAIQRIGRAGHGVGQTSRGTFLAAHLADRVCAAVTARAVVEGSIEPVQSLQAPLDVLAQVLLSMLAFEDWHPDDLYNFIRTAAPYHDLSQRRFELVLDMLEGRYGESRIRELQPKISLDRLEQSIRVRKGALLSLYASGGVIPDRGYYALRHAHSGAKIGELDEEFVWEARIGQVFTLGAQNWRIRQITHSEVRVLPSAPGKPAPPFWRAEENPRSFHLSEMIGRFLEMAETRLKEPAFVEELMRAYAMDLSAARGLIEELQRQRIHTGAPLPHRHHLLIEETSLGTGRAAGRQVICHTGWGGRVNRPLAMALEAAWEERFGTTPQIFCTNDTVTFLLPPDVAGETLLSLVRADTFEELLYRRLPQTGFFGARFRECAGRALLLPRRHVSQRMPLWLTRLRAQKLLSAVAAYPDFPILVETWRTCLQDEFDLPQLRVLLRELETGTIARSYVHTDFPSPLARAAAWQQINVHMYQGDRPAPDHGGRLSADLLHEVTLQPGLRPPIDGPLADGFEKKRQRLAPGYAPDSSEEMLDWIKERIALPWLEWQSLLKAAARDHQLDPQFLTQALAEKVVRLQLSSETDRALIVARERIAPVWESVYRHVSPSPEVRLLNGQPLAIDERVKKSRISAERPFSPAAELLGQWLQFYGPQAPAAIAETLALSLSFLTPLIEELAAAQIIIVGQLLKDGGPEELCDRENFEMLLRLSRKAALPALESLPIEHLALFLADHQGLTQSPRAGDDLAVRLNQLLCWAAPAAHWETEILPARLPDYQPEWLDTLMQTHDLRWVGRRGHKIIFCFEDELDLVAGRETAQDDPTDSPKVKKKEDLSALFADGNGRYPFAALERMAGLNAAALNERLWQWVWRGAVSNDTFAALRRGVETRFRMAEPSAARPAGAARRPGRSMFQRWRGSRPSIGNWFRLVYPEPMENLLDREERNKERVRVLLDRYGVVFRELLARELPLLRWSALFRSLRLMELSGEVLAGHFFEGVEGLQFISAPALQHLGSILPEDAVFWLNAIDPASLCGLELAALRGRLPRRLPGVHLVYHGVRPVIFSHRMGGRLEIMVPPDHPRLSDYFNFLDHLLTRRIMPLRSIRIQHINGAPAADQKDYVAVLADLYETITDHQEVTLYRRHAG